nr:ribonuclease H-like domain, reverse transcriptase, RNA-dependent DNA polymerase [Tanacetum cinerariifolium]
MVYLGNEQGSKAYRLFNPITQRIYVSRDVKFKENETWDWKDYISEHINDEPEWTDFKIENLEVLNEHHDQGFQPIEKDNEFPNNDDDYASPTRDSPTNSQTHHTPSTHSSEKQATVALSLCESEFIAAAATAIQALWLKRLLSKLTHSEEYKVTIRVDNKSVIALMKNPLFHRRSKHIDMEYHFIRECVKREDIQVEFLSKEYQKANILTKALPKIKFLTMRQLIELENLRSNVCD